ncbi:MAG TPA: sigma-70 family RNA polymerase sigma factor [Kofleriaceae bacterium]|nr:sigma-70 family RNA polymerase sigma factor [Kofleriaceae bacterium]
MEASSPERSARDPGDPVIEAVTPPRRLAAGTDHAAIVLDIDALYAEHAPFIGRVIARLTGDGAHVDDLIQETFIIAFQKRATFDGRAKPRTWLYGIAQHLAMRHRRGVGRWLRALGRFGDEPVALAVDPDRELDRARAAVVVADVLARLPFKHREVFVLYELEELEGAEIAALLDIPVNTVWTRLHHARKRFEALMRTRVGRDHGA